MDLVRFSLDVAYNLLLLSVLLDSSEAACVSTLTDPEGDLAPPLYPQFDLSFLGCTWTLNAQEGMVIEITFEEVALDDSTDENENCLDSITVYDGTITEIIPPFCGDGPDWPRFPIRLLTKSSTMTVTLVKNRERSRGFRAKYKHVPPRQEIIAAINQDNPAIVLFDRLSSLSSSETIHLLGSFRPSALSFDPISKMFYFTDIQQKSIGRASLEDKSVNFIIEENVDIPLGIAVAYLTGLLYWTDAGRHEVSVSRLDGTFRKTLMTSLPDCRTPKGIVLSRDNQYIFWTCENRIEKSKADGSERNPNFVIDNVVDPTALAIDIDGTYLYWVDTVVGNIERIRVDGVDRTEVLISDTTFLTQLHSLVLDEFAYFFTHKSDKRVYMVERESDVIQLRLIQLEPPKSLGGLYYYKSDMTLPAQHSCTIDNGGCARLCFPDGNNVNCDVATTTSTTTTTECSSFSLDKLFSACLSYTIVGLVILILCLIILTCVSVLCCCGCRRCKSRGNEHRRSLVDHVNFTVPDTPKLRLEYHTEGEYVTVA